MKSIFVSVVAAAVVAAGVSFGTARWASRQHPVNVHDAGWLRQELKLSEIQAAQVAKLTEDYRQAVSQCCVKHCDARLGLSEELGKATVDLPAAQAAVAKMCAAANEVEQATLRHILQVREVLSPDQRAQYAKLINQQLCTMPGQP